MQTEEEVKPKVKRKRRTKKKNTGWLNVVKDVVITALHIFSAKKK